MTQHDPTVRLHHMLDHAREAHALSLDMTREDLDRDRVRFLALVHLVEVVGEAAGRVPSPVREMLRDIPWRDITGMRHRLVHDYVSIDRGVLWTVVRHDLPVLIARLEDGIPRVEKAGF